MIRTITNDEYPKDRESCGGFLRASPAGNSPMRARPPSRIDVACALDRPGESSNLRQERSPVPLRIEFRDKDSQSRSQLQNFEIGYTPQTSLDRGNDSTGNVPAPQLADRSKFLLGPAAFITKQHHLAADNVTRGIHAPAHLSGFGLVIVWNSKQLVRESRRRPVEIVAKPFRKITRSESTNSANP